MTGHDRIMAAAETNGWTVAPRKALYSRTLTRGSESVTVWFDGRAAVHTAARWTGSDLLNMIIPNGSGKAETVLAWLARDAR